MIFAGIAIGMYELLAMDKRKDDFLEDWLAVLIPALGVAVLPMILLKLYQQQKFTMFHPNIDVPIDERIALGKQLAEPIPANEARS